MDEAEDRVKDSVGASPPNRGWILAGAAIGAIFLWFALRQADFAGARRVLSGTQPAWLLVVAAAGMWFMAIKTARWAVILRPLGRPPGGSRGLNRLVYLGTAANLVVAHTGELLRATLLARRRQIAASAVLATIGLERIFDFVALIAMIAVALLIDRRLSPLLWPVGAISLVLIGAGVVVAAAFMRPSPRLRAFVHRVIGWLRPQWRNWIVNQLQRAGAGFAALRDPAAVLWVAVLSLVQWSGIVLAIWASARAVGVEIAVSTAILVFALTVIGLTLPSSPVQLGTTQLAYVVGFELSGASADAALAASIVYTVFVNLTMLTIGALCWLDLGRETARKSRTPTHESKDRAT